MMRAGIAAALLAMSGQSLAAGGVTVVTAQRIHTMNPAQPHAQAMAYDDSGAILALGDTAMLLKRYPQARRIDAGQATIVPGLIDAHGHVSELGRMRASADLTGANAKEEVLRRLHEFVARPGNDKGWIIGWGWDQNRWPAKEFPGAADLDAQFHDRPVWLHRIDGHAGWANGAAMKLIKRDLSGTWQPDGGKIVRDAAGKPTGVFVDGAMSLIDEVRPATTQAEIEHQLELAMGEAVANGLTGVHDAGIPLAELRAYQHLADGGKLPMRITAMADGDSDALNELCRSGLYRHSSGRLQMRTVKLYADGALGSRGAALLADYSDDPGNRGIMVMSPGQLFAAETKAKRCGVQVATHAIGDRGNRIVLDTYAQVLGNDVAGGHRWRIEHAQILEAGDLHRVAKMHVIASMQPTHATSDMPWAEDRIGPQRITGAYAWRKLRDDGVLLALGSDFPVESVDPRLGLASAVTRADEHGLPAGGWYPEEKLTAYEALRGFTLDAAYAGFVEKEVGSLEPGKRADFVVLDKDPLAIDPAQLRALVVRATYVDGKPVYQAK